MDDPAQVQATNPNPQAPINPGDDLAQLTKDPLPTFTQEVQQFESGHGKEQEPPAHLIEVSEVVKEIPTTPEIEPQEEVSSYIEKIEKEAELQNPVTDDYTQQVLLKSSANQNPVVTLPLTEDQVKQGLHHQLWEAITWLARWCVRQAKLLPGRVKYKS